MASIPRGTLPRKTRLRLWLQNCIDSTAYRLVCHDHCTAATWLWKLTGGWE